MVMFFDERREAQIANGQVAVTVNASFSFAKIQ